MNIELNLEEINIITYNVKIYFIIIFTYYTSLKIADLNNKTKNNILFLTISILISIVCSYIKFRSNSFDSIMCLTILIPLVFSKLNKKDISFSIIINIISLSINYILLFLSSIITFLPNVLLKNKNDYVSLILLIIVHAILLGVFATRKKFRKGFSFINKKLKNEYVSTFILNISIIVLFTVIVLSEYNKTITRTFGIGLIIFSIIMFITIQKSLQLYYKQKLLIQDLEETKKELEDKKLEIEKLEKENLNFSKVSHYIAHKQKSLEHKLNELMLKNEITSEIDIRDRINAISKEMQPRQAKELSKTDIVEIDDMLKYMQSECINDKIEFELQISGNIYQMINNHIRKEDLEILLADHIKNAIIAINHSDNSNKSILVRLGIIDGCYSLYIYDSGIEFEIDTLEKLGKVPSTTHKESGGTGMGFMNTFDTLKKYNASMIINEYGKPSKDNYTKVLMIKFDKKNEFKIISYRSEEIENKCNSEDINVEKLITNQK